MNSKDLLRVVEASIVSKQSLLIIGPPGIGKTDIMSQACHNAGADLIVTHPAIADPTDYKGFPAKVNETEAGFLMYGDLLRLIRADKPTVCFIDDLGQALPSVQNALMQLIWGGRLNGYKVSEHVVFMAASNRKGDKSNVMGISEAVKTRFTSIIELHVDTDSWINWALSHGVSAEMIAFIKWAPDMLLKHAPTTDIVNSPNPRTVVNADNHYKFGHIDRLAYELIKGAVGEEFAVKFTGFIKVFKSLPDIDALINDPLNAMVPGSDKGDIMYAICSALAFKANKKNFDNIVLYCNRLPDEFAIFCILSATKKNSELMACSEFLNWARRNASVLMD